MNGLQVILWKLCLTGILRPAQTSVIRETTPDPESSISIGSDWYRCHGLPCSQWEEVESIMAKINVNISYDLEFMAPHAHPEESPDIWLTPNQARRLLHQELTLRMRVRRRRSLSEPPLLRLQRAKRWEKYLKATAPVRVRRKIESFDEWPERKWDLPIIYKLERRSDFADKDRVRRALDHWMRQTCLQFFELNEEAQTDQPHLKITNIGYRCASFVGRVNLPPGSPQQINLATSCLDKPGVPVHEIGHALGLWHEHQRSDRDAYIQVIDKNVNFWATPNFAAAPEEYLDNYDMPYDYNSVMHYGPSGGSIYGNTTIMTRDPLFQRNIGQRVGLSFIDAKVINRAYCSDYCGTGLPFTCLHGGYQDPKSCGQCRCPDGLAGRRCETVASSSDGACGGAVTLREGERLDIMTPGFVFGIPYAENVECNWLINVPENHTMSLHFEDDFDIFCLSQVCYHWVEIRRTKDLSMPGPRFCCGGTPRDILVSEGNTMLITFRSNFAMENEVRRRGFKAVIVTSEQEEISNEVPRQPELSEPDGQGGDGGQLEVDPQDGSGEVPSPALPEFTWSEWSECTGHQCACGSCSSRRRHRLCGEVRCEGDLDAEEESICGRQCDSYDQMLFYAGRIYSIQCPICCNGYEIREDGYCGAPPSRPDSELNDTFPLSGATELEKR